MKSLNRAIYDYLALRRSLGFKLREYGECLREFASFLKKNGAADITKSWRWNMPPDAKTKSLSRGHAA